MKKSVAIVLTAVMLAGSLTACGLTERLQNVDKEVLEAVKGAVSDDEKESTEEYEMETAETESAESFDESTEQELYNLYINVNNMMMGRIYDSLDRYFKYVDFQEEFTLLDDWYDCYSVDYLMDDVESAYELASSKPEKSELDEAYLALYTPLTELMNTLTEIYDYTDMKSYLDDDFAKGKELHAKLWSAFGEYEERGELFMDKLSEEEEIRNEATKKEMLDNGYEAFYAVVSVIDSAQAIEEELYEQGITDDNILDMDMEKIQPLYDEFTSNVEMVLEYSKDEDKLREEGIPVNSAYWGTFISSMRDTKTSMTEVLAKVKAGEPLNEFDTMITMTGECSIASFQEGISSMINDYNHFVSY